MLTSLEIWLLDVAVTLSWLLLAVNYYAYKLLGRDEYSECELDPIFSFLVSRLGAWAFLVAFFLLPFIMLATVAVTSEPYRPVMCGVFIGMAAFALFHDTRIIKRIRQELEAEEALDGPEADLTIISVPEEHKREYCDRLRCKRVSSFKWLNESWICCGIARNPSKPGDVIITCHAVPRGDDKLAVLTVEQRPDEAAIMLKIIHDALAYYLAEEAYKRYGYELGDEEDEQEKEA